MSHLSPLGHHGVPLALHLVGACVQQDGVLIDQGRAPLGLHTRSGLELPSQQGGDIGAGGDVSEISALCGLNEESMGCGLFIQTG